MQVWINGKRVQAEQNARICDLAPDFDVFVRNGYGISKDAQLFDGDEIIATKKGCVPSDKLIAKMIIARNGDWISNKLQNACVCVCGLGGLGSNVAAMLARLGVKKLILVDFDFVDTTNLNRQNYFVNDIGSKKTEATARIIKNINPYIDVFVKDTFVTAQNALQVVENAAVVVEAFDSPESKAELVNTILENTDKYVVASSGMAGANSSNDIITRRAMSRLYVVGDNVSEAREGLSLMAPRVNICAGHQANMVLRLLIGEQEC